MRPRNRLACVRAMLACMDGRHDVVMTYLGEGASLRWVERCRHCQSWMMCRPPQSGKGRTGHQYGGKWVLN